MKGGRGGIKARRVAFGGVFAGLAAAIMLVGGLLPISTFSAPIFASLCIFFLYIELGTKTALLAYAATALIALVFVPDRELTILFVMLFGYYPVLKHALDRIRQKALRIFVKLLYFNVVTVAAYALLLFLFTVPAVREEFAANSIAFWTVLLAMGNVLFLVYDLLMDKLKIIYFAKVRRHLF